MRVLDLFSGIGGFALGLERAGMQTVAFCEIEPYCREVLKRHWPEVPIHDDVRSLSGEQYRGIDLIAGGFPCQDASVAGKGSGLAGERTGLWREFHRLISECRPRWVLAENVPGLRTRGADRVLSDLETLGYTPRPLVVGAWAVRAPHRRDRVWIVADRHRDPVWAEQGWAESRRAGSAERGELGAAVADRNGRRFDRQRNANTDARCQRNDEGASGHEPDGCGSADMGNAERELGGSGAFESWRRPEGRVTADRSGEDMGNTRRAGSQERHAASESGDQRHVAGQRHRFPAGPGPYQHDWEPPRVIPRAQSGMGSDADGLPERLVPRERREALRALGNSVVPQVVEAIGRAIMRAHHVP